MTTPQHALDAAKEINAALSRTHYVNIAAIIARHPDPELARLREENERLRFPHPRLHETQKQLLDVIAERDRLGDAIDALEQRILDDNKAFGCELRDPNGTIWEHADKLQKENADLRQSLENHAQANDKLVVEVADLRRDRERLMKNYLISPVVCGTVLGSLYGAFINTTSPAVHPNVRETLKYAHGLLSAAIDKARAGKTEGGV